MFTRMLTENQAVVNFRGVCADGEDHISHTPALSPAVTEYSCSFFQCEFFLSRNTSVYAATFGSTASLEMSFGRSSPSSEDIQKAERLCEGTTRVER